MPRYEEPKRQRRKGNSLFPEEVSIQWEILTCKHTHRAMEKVTIIEMYVEEESGAIPGS